jgi:hypothetical protein
MSRARAASSVRGPSAIADVESRRLLAAEARQLGLQRLDAKVGHESETSQVDADDRNLVRSHVTGDADEGAIPSEYEREGSVLCELSETL